jgi:hypothetical protein
VDVPTFLKDPDDPNPFAVVGQVHDPEDMIRRSCAVSVARPKAMR